MGMVSHGQRPGGSTSVWYIALRKCSTNLLLVWSGRHMAHIYAHIIMHMHMCVRVHGGASPARLLQPEGDKLYLFVSVVSEQCPAR